MSINDVWFSFLSSNLSLLSDLKSTNENQNLLIYSFDPGLLLTMLTLYSFFYYKPPLFMDSRR